MSKSEILLLAARRLKNSFFRFAVVAMFTSDHERRDVLPDRSPNPPYGVGREPEALFGLEALDRPYQADIALRDEIRDRQAVAAIAPGDLGDEA